MATVNPFYKMFNLQSIVKLALCLSMIACSSISFSEEKLSFVYIQGMAGQKVGSQIVFDVYKRLGISAEVVPMPGRRALREAVSGRKDGESVRIFAVGEKYPELVRIPTPIFEFLTMGFARKDSSVVLNEPKDLENYTVVRASGVQHTKRMTEGMKGIRVVEYSNLLMPFVSLNRADIALTGRFNGLILLKKNKVSNVEVVGKPLQVNPLYHYVHKKHAALVPKIDAILKEMKASGELSELKARYEQEYLDSIVGSDNMIVLDK